MTVITLLIVCSSYVDALISTKREGPDFSYVARRHSMRWLREQSVQSYLIVIRIHRDATKQLGTTKLESWRTWKPVV